MKRGVEAGSRSGAEADTLLLARQCALSLLTRSVSFGHGRLAVLRLAKAVDIGADVPQEYWMYCHDAASRSKDDRLRELYLQAARAATCRSTVPPVAAADRWGPTTIAPQKRPHGANATLAIGDPDL